MNSSESSQQEPILGNKESQKQIIDNLEVPVVNPFINRTAEFSFYERLKFIICLFTLIPIRLFLIISLLLTATVISKLLLIGVSKEDIKNPLSPGRQRIIKLYKYVARAILFVMGVYWIRVKGKPDPRARIFTPNHISFIDPIYMYWATQCHFVAKSTAADIPLLGSLFKAVQPILVDRLSPTSRADTSAEIERRACWDKQPDWNPVTIFPEGTCGNGTALISFKYGPFRPGVPVQPVALRYPFINFDVSFVNNISSSMLFLRSLSQFSMYIEVEYLPLYEPSAKEQGDLPLFANNVRKKMASALNIPLTDHSYEDVLLQVEAMKRSMSPNQVVLSKNMKSQFSNLSFNDLKSQLREFAKIDELGRGYLTKEQFRNALGLPDSKYVSELFNLLDVDESGKIDFREYIAGRALISQELTTEETIQLAFNSFDLNKDGFIELHELMHAMQRGFPGISEDEVVKLFNSIDRKHPDKVDYDEFYAHAKKKPEYMSFFLAYKKEASEEQD